MNYSIFLEDETAHDIESVLAAVSLIEIYNEGPNSCYYGTPEPSLVTTASITNASTVITMTGGKVPRVGMEVSGTGIGVGAKVLSVSGNTVTLSVACTATNASASLTFSAESLATAGLPIAMGETKSFASDHANRYLQRGLRLFPKSGEQFTVRIHHVLN